MEPSALFAVAMIVVLVLAGPVGAAWVANRKGRSPVLWGIFGVFFGILALLLAILASPRQAEA